MAWGYRITGLDHLAGMCSIKSATSKEVWKEGWKAHRCVIPASYDFELLDDVKYVAQPSGSDVTYLAGIYRQEEKYPASAVLMTETLPDDNGRRIAMPLVLPRRAITAWINPERSYVRHCVTW